MFQTRDESFGTIKYAGRSKAKVLDINDPAGRGRIVVDHPILGVTGWIPYLTAPGMFSVPEIDDIVYVECDCGYESHPIAWGNLNKGDNSSADSSINEAFTRVGPTNRGFYTPGGHLIEFDDGSTIAGTDKGIRITTSDGTKLHLNEDPTSPGIDIETSSGQTITVDGLADTIEIATSGGATVSLDGLNDVISAEASFGDKIEISASDGLQGSTPSGTSFSFKDGEVSIAGTNGSVDITNDEVSVSDSAGNTLSFTASDGAKIEAGASTLELKPSGQVALTGATGELVAILGELLTALTTEAPAGFGAPLVNLAKYIELQTKVTGMTT